MGFLIKLRMGINSVKNDLQKITLRIAIIFSDCEQEKVGVIKHFIKLKMSDLVICLVVLISLPQATKEYEFFFTFFCKTIYNFI